MDVARFSIIDFLDRFERSQNVTARTGPFQPEQIEQISTIKERREAEDNNQEIKTETITDYKKVRTVVLIFNFICRISCRISQSAIMDEVTRFGKEKEDRGLSRLSLC